MSLANRLSEVTPYPSNRGCMTCAWINKLPAADKSAFDEWVQCGRSLAQLHDVAFTDPDNPLKVSLTGFRHHMRHHQDR